MAHPVKGLHLNFGEKEFLLNSNKSDTTDQYTGMTELAIVILDMTDEAIRHLALLAVQALESNQPKKTLGFAINSMLEEAFRTGFHKARHDERSMVENFDEGYLAKILPQYSQTQTPLNLAIRFVIKEAFVCGFSVARKFPELDIVARQSN